MEDLTYREVLDFLWKEGDLSYKLWKQQEPIYETVRNLPQTSQTIVLLCARQFGKSVLGSLFAIEDCLRNPGVVVMIVGPELKQTRAIVNPRIRLLSADAPEGLVRFVKSEDTWYIGDSELILGGFDVKNATRQRGKTLHKVYIEEIVDSNPDEYNDALRSDIGPALTHSKNAQMVFLTTPPKIPDHPFLLDTVPQAELDGAFFKYTIDDNKALTKEQYDKCVKLCGGKHTVDFLREYMCEIVRDPDKVVIPHFSEQDHIGKFELPVKSFYTVSVDFGGVRDKTCAILHTYDFYNDKDLIIAERYWEPNTPTDVIVKGLRELEAGYEIEARITDVPGQTKIDLQTTFNYEVQTPVKTDWQAGVNQMQVKFSLPQRILIDPRCKFLIQSCKSGTLNKQKTDFERTDALGHCDALASLMYGIRSQNRDNPYPNYNKQYHDNYYTPPAHLSDGEKVAEALAPKTFTTHKKFGSFK